MEEALIVLDADGRSAVQAARRQIESTAKVLQAYGSQVLIAQVAPSVKQSLSSLPGVSGVYEGIADAALAERLDEVGRLGIAAWNQRHSPSYRSRKLERPGEGLAWDHPDYEPEG